MKLLDHGLYGLLVTAALAAAAPASSDYRVFAPEAGAGGGPLTGGAYSAFTTIAADGAAAPLHGGGYEITGGLERRRETVAEESPIFRDGFEGG